MGASPVRRRLGCVIPRPGCVWPREQFHATLGLTPADRAAAMNFLAAANAIEIG